MPSVSGLERLHKLAHGSRSSWSVNGLGSFLMVLVLELYKFDFHPWTLLRENSPLLFVIFRVFLSIPHSPSAFLTFDYFPLNWHVLIVPLLRPVVSSDILFYRNHPEQWVEHICFVPFLKVKRWLTDDAPGVLVSMRVTHRLPVDGRRTLRNYTLLLWYGNMLKRCGCVYIKLVFG